MPTPDLPKVEAAIIELTNAFRREQGLGSVVPNAVLRKSADDFARYLARTNTFSHTADGRGPGERAKAGGYAFCAVAENLSLNLDSRGFETTQLARDAVEGWKKSPGHRKNLVAPHVTEIAVAVAKAPGEEKYLSVQLFGRPISLQYSYTVSNAAESPVAYTFDGRSFSIGGRQIITHTECQPATLAFDSAGSWLSKQSIGARFAVTPGAKFLIEPASGSSGRVLVREEAAPAASKPGAKPSAKSAQPAVTAQPSLSQPAR